MNRFFLIITRVMMVFFGILSLMNNSIAFKVLFLALALMVGIGGQYVYKKLRSDKEAKEDDLVELESKKKIVSSIDAVSNIKPALKGHVTSKFQNLLNKSVSSSVPDKIRELDKLRTEGLLTDEEFNNAKKKLLGA